MNPLSSFNVKDLSNRLRIKRGVQILLLLLVAVQALVFFNIPLMPLETDSALYYMNVHYLISGEYLTNSTYPSFHAPSQLYPVMGYSVVLLLCKGLGSVTHLSWALLVKFFQFGLYVASGVLLFKTVRLLSNACSATVSAFFFLAYYPLFNYANLVMSENYAIFLLLLFIFFFCSFLRSGRGWLLCAAFFFAGYSILVKPVYLVVCLMMLGVSLFPLLRQRVGPGIFLISLVCLAAAPLAQAAVSKKLYGNYALRKGVGWNLWNSVIGWGGLVPKHSSNLKILQKIFADHHEEVPLGGWWQVTRELSRYGYDEAFTQEICLGVALDGIRERPVAYIKTALVHSLWVARTVTNPRYIHYSDVGDYCSRMKEFGLEKQHEPLTEQLLQQPDYRGFPGHAFWLKLNRFFYKIIGRMAHIIQSGFSMVFFFSWGIFIAVRLVRTRFDNHYLVLAFLWAAPFIIVLCSNLAECPSARMVLPAIPLLIANLAMGLGAAGTGIQRLVTGK